MKKNFLAEEIEKQRERAIDAYAKKEAFSDDPKLVEEAEEEISDAMARIAYYEYIINRGTPKINHSLVFLSVTLSFWVSGLLVGEILFSEQFIEPLWLIMAISLIVCGSFVLFIALKTKELR